MFKCIYENLQSKSQLKKYLMTIENNISNHSNDIVPFECYFFDEKGFEKVDDESLKKNNIFVVSSGLKNKIFIHKTCLQKKIRLEIVFYKNSNTVVFDKNVTIKKNMAIKLTSNSCFFCGENSVVTACKVLVTCEKNREVFIGSNCLLSSNIIMRTSDAHKIIDLTTSKTINQSLFGIHVGNHCWIGQDVSILKDVVIGNNCVIGSFSVVTSSLEASNNVVIAGVPAKVIRSNINWDIAVP